MKFLAISRNKPKKKFKVKALPFRVKNAGLLLAEFDVIAKMLDQLNGNDLTSNVCDDLVQNEKKLKIEITDMVIINDLKKVLDYVPKLKAKHTSIDAAVDLLELVSFKTFLKTISSSETHFYQFFLGFYFRLAE